MGRRKQRSAAAVVPEAVPPAPPAAASLRIRIATAAAVTLVAFGAYLRTCAPNVTLVDSGELIVAAHGLGVAHPPGFPVWTVLAHAFTRLPWDTVAWRVNLASAAFGALAAGVVSLVAFAVGERLRQRPSWIVAGAAGLLFAFALTPWRYATIAEVYTLNASLLAAVLLLVLQGRLYAAAAVYGLALGVHHATVLVMLPALLVLAVHHRREWRRIAAAAVGTAAVVAIVYAYLPWAAARGPALAWGDPRTLGTVLAHVSGRQYQAYFDVSVGRELDAVARTLWRQLGPGLGVVAALGGAAVLARRDRRLLAALALAVVANVALCSVYDIAEDKDAYYMPTVLTMAILAAPALGTLPARGAVAGAVLAVAATVFANGAASNRSRDHVAPDFVENVAASLPPDAVLVTTEWQLYAPFLYRQEVERFRTDVHVVDVNLLRRSWYVARHLTRAYPELMRRVEPEASAFLERLRHWERDPEAFAREESLRSAITERFHALVLAFVREGRRAGGAFATMEIALPNAGPDPELATVLFQSSSLVPRGLVFELADTPGFRDPGQVPLRTRGLFDGTVPVPDNDTALRIKVRPLYAAMATNRGRYLAGHGRHEQAVQAYQEALALDPGHRSAAQGLEQSLAALRR